MFALFLAIWPVVAVLILWFIFKGRARKETYLFLGFLSLTAFYIFAPDPSVITGFLTGGQLTPGAVAFFGLLAFIFLAIAAFAFKRYRG